MNCLAYALLFLTATCHGQALLTDTAYLSDVKNEMKKTWPKSRTINLVFHGHSVPAGYWLSPEVNTLESYPHLLLEKLKKKYPYAVINVIVTAIGGENSISGATRMDQVLAHDPDVLFIDYALNDRPAGLKKAGEAWEKMIRVTLERNIKIILLTPSPDQRVNILEKNNPLELHARQIRQLANTHLIGLTDSFLRFRKIAEEDGKISDYMSQVNHPNRKGHEVIANDLMKWF